MNGLVRLVKHIAAKVAIKMLAYISNSTEEDGAPYRMIIGKLIV